MLSILNVRSDTHNSCEDTVWAEETVSFIVGGIFDGCSTGKNSYWASQTIAYLYKALMMNYKILSDVTSYMVLAKIETIARMCSLDNQHFLSTAILFVYDKETMRLSFRIFGDGVLYINDVEYSQEQQNTPDYLGYQMFKKNLEKYEYFDKYPVQHVENVTKFQVCSDGIQAIMPNQYHVSDKNPYTLLLASPTSENYLKRMWNILHREKFSLGDDLSIVSYAIT
jgi:hypothetical protein